MHTRKCAHPCPHTRSTQTHSRAHTCPLQVSGANFLGEMIEWCGFALAASSFEASGIVCACPCNLCARPWVYPLATPRVGRSFVSGLWSRVWGLCSGVHCHTLCCVSVLWG